VHPASAQAGNFHEEKVGEVETRRCRRIDDLLCWLQGVDRASGLFDKFLNIVIA
jgi:hypothetical protein